MAIFTEANSLPIVDFDCLEDCREDLLGLLLVYSFKEILRVRLPVEGGWGLDHAERTKLVEALLNDLRDVVDGRLLTDGVDLGRLGLRGQNGPRWWLTFDFGQVPSLAVFFTLSSRLP